MRLRVGLLTVLIALAALVYPHAQTSSSWPDFEAAYWLRLSTGTDGDYGGVTGENDNTGSKAGAWRCNLVVTDASCAITAALFLGDSPTTIITTSDIHVKYYVHGIAVSDWIASPFNFDLARSNAALSGLCTGFHGIEVDVQAGTGAYADRDDFKYTPIYLKFNIGNAACTEVPMMMKDCEYCLYNGQRDHNPGPRVIYVDPTGIVPHAYPADTTVFTPWSNSPLEADLYQEEMAPHTEQFVSAELWFAEPDSEGGQRYARALLAKNGGNHEIANRHNGYLVQSHESFPFQDGGRGVAWTSNFIQGVVGESGDFYFVEAGGPFREMHPDGSVETIAGWRVASGKYPIWPGRDVTTVRQNMELVGDFQGCGNSGTGFHYPTDVAIDPFDDEIFYIVENETSRICKVVEGAGAGGQALITLLAGSSAGTSGFVDATGSSARFYEPTSAVADADCACLYVTDTRNDAIRKVMLSDGATTTLWGEPGQRTRIASATRTFGIASTPGAPTIANSGTGGSYAAVARYYRVEWVTADDIAEAGSSSRELSDLGTASSLFTPDGSHDAAVVTRPSAPSVGETHWTVWGSTNGTAYYKVSPRIPIATTTYSDTVVTGAYGSAFELWPDEDGLAYDAGTNHYFYQNEAREYSTFTVDSTQASNGDRPDFFRPMTIRITSTGLLVISDTYFGSIRKANPTTHVTSLVTDLYAPYDLGQDLIGWSWFDVDRWGNSGPLDSVYNVSFQASHCPGSPNAQANESYCWSTIDGPQSVHLFNDASVYPNGFGKLAETDPPHYGWLVAVDPRGAVYFAGGGEHGITRIRKRRAQDPYPANYSDFFSSDYYWMRGGSHFTPSTSFLKHGYNAHNYLGFADAWAYADGTATDEELIEDFDIPVDDITTDAKNFMLAYIRVNTGAVVDSNTPDAPGPLKIRLPRRVSTALDLLMFARPPLMLNTITPRRLTGHNTPDHKGGRK